MNDDRLIILNRAGSETAINDPFGPMKALYAAMREDPNAIPELSPETRAAILAEIASKTEPMDKAGDEKILEEQYLHDPDAPAYFIPDRADRRRAAAKARKARREKSRKYGSQPK